MIWQDTHLSDKYILLGDTPKTLTQGRQKADFCPFTLKHIKQCILKNKNAYDIMPTGKEKQTVHAGQQYSKSPRFMVGGFSIPNFEMARLNAIG